MKLSVIGLGKLGSPLAAVLANGGHNVIGYDINSNFVDSIINKKAPVDEPLLQQYLESAKEKLTATDNIAEAIENSEISFIIVPTPSELSGNFSLEFIKSAIEQLAPVLQAKQDKHIISITSTVLPGSCDNEIIPLIEKLTGKQIGCELGLAYNPEFIALGNVINDLENPDLVLIGQSERWVGDQIREVWEQVIKNSATILQMNLVEAEMVKISINTFVTTKISFANLIGEICESLDNCSVDEVCSAISTDSRIGAKYFRGATPYGGPCFPRDNLALSYLANSLGITADIANATERINSRQIKRIIKTINSVANPHSKIAVLGLAYKPNTPVIENSAGINLCKELINLDYQIGAHDFHAVAAAESSLGSDILLSSNLTDILDQADIIVIMTPTDEYKKVASEINKVNASNGKAIFIIDCWGIVEDQFQGKNIELRRLGIKY